MTKEQHTEIYNSVLSSIKRLEKHLKEISDKVILANNDLNIISSGTFYLEHEDAYDEVSRIDNKLRSAILDELAKDADFGDFFKKLTEKL